MLTQYCKARPIPYAIKTKVEEELDRLVAEGTLEPVQIAEWASPIVPVIKSDKKSVRICGDFKQTVNPVAKLDKYPIPKVEDLFVKLTGGRTFTKIDLSQAYLQVPLDEESKKYVVVNTHKGLFRYTQLPFGISAAPGIFQRVMDNILQGIPGVVVYLDDILITGPTVRDHLESVLDRLMKAGLHIKKDKCTFLSSSVTYLGHKIDSEGLHPLPSKVRAVMEAPCPSNPKQLKSYLGLITYYAKFLPNLSSHFTNYYKKTIPGNGEKNNSMLSKSQKNYLLRQTYLFTLILNCKLSWRVMHPTMGLEQFWDIVWLMVQSVQLRMPPDP